MTLDCLHIPWNGCYCMLYPVGPQSRESYTGLWKWMSYTPLVPTTSAIVRLFSVGLLDPQRHEALDVQCYADTRAAIDILWKVSLLFPSPHHPWSVTMQAVHMAPRSGQCSVNLMPVVDIEHWEMSGIVSTLILWYCQVLQYHVHLYFWSTFMVDGHDNHPE